MTELFICRTIGCTSIFAKWWEWPHREICERVVLTKEKRRRNAALRGNRA